ncbi:TRAP transporter substrate-binding protein [Pseudooceanicola spongiae]|uniref:DctP family TRAP transporter solute-binding subunit n=1 Tax=Pseudooceanicola spongiae TaxID=2613965 RepID=A0A7L9WPX2_9RHOB|nr:TRAP transporter substrate-binding protein [Pseudooceanicola spongiae]QOL82361.1 DctP family TRAP transporter solute-binding subunit [Pseudooceanicola spongiae]
MFVTKTLKALMLGGIAAAALSSAAFAQDMTLKLGHPANEDNIWNKASEKFAEEVEALTEGRIAVEVFPNETLGKEMDVINGMQLGTADMTITGESLQNWAPMAALLAIPYGYTSLEDMDAVAGGELGDQIEQQIIEKVGIRPIAYFARGPRNLTSNRPIKSVEDLKGLKMRVPNVPLFLNVWQALGASPTPMAFSEVFTSLQNGTIDAQENPLALIKSANFNEVQDYVNQTQHVRSWIYLTISEMAWGQMSEEDQQAVMEAASRTQKWEREQFLVEEAQLQTQLEELGMQFVEVDNAAFAAAAKEAVLSSVAEEIRPQVEQLFAD